MRHNQLLPFANQPQVSAAHPVPNAQRSHVIWCADPFGLTVVPEGVSAMDDEANRLSARAARYLSVGSNVGVVAAKVAGQRLFGMTSDDSKNAAELAKALGGQIGRAHV